MSERAIRCQCLYEGRNEEEENMNERLLILLGVTTALTILLGVVTALG